MFLNYPGAHLLIRNKRIEIKTLIKSPRRSPLGLSNIEPEPSNRFEPEPSKSKSSNKLMPSRRRRQQQESQQPTGEPLWKEDHSQSPQKNSLASILGALDRNSLEKLKNKPTEGL